MRPLAELSNRLRNRKLPHNHPPSKNARHTYKDSTVDTASSLMALDEKTIRNHFLTKLLRWIALWFRNVDDMADTILAQRDTRRLVTRWLWTLVKGPLEAKTRFNRTYYYQRNLFGDPEKIVTWFDALCNIKGWEQCIKSANIYNFDKTEVPMG
jgi:hypothetical protein